MADPIDRPQLNHCPQANRNKSLKHAFDDGFISCAHPPDNPDAENGDSTSRSSISDSETSDGSESSWLDDVADLAASFRAVTEFAARAEQAELEAARAREASRLAAETRHAELDAEFARAAARTQSQVAAASVERAADSGRKRKRVDEVRGDSSSSPRERAMLLSLLQCSLI